MPPPSATGVVHLVGAGPGDASLITLRGAELLQQADLILYDYLANPALLHLANADAETICLGRHGAGRLMNQEEVNAAMVWAAADGKTVVRLKSGDPVVFARAAEEISALEAADVPYTITPGVTAAFACAAYAGAPLTDRDHASAVALVTAHEADRDASRLDFNALARFPGTLAFYMGVTTAADWTTALMAAGKPADTPAIIVRRATFSDQLVVRCTLQEVASEIESRKLRPPVVVLVGESAGREHASWFERRPLHGARVLVLRPAAQAEGLRRPLEELGAEALLQPAIEIGPPDDWTPVDAAIKRLADFDWLVFSSANGVDYFLNRLWNRGGDGRTLAGLKLAAIGPGTAAALARHHLQCDLVAEEHRAEGLATAIAPHARDARMLLLRANRGREVLAEQLRTAGAAVEQVVVYASSDVASPDETILHEMQQGRIHVVAVTSSAIARNAVRLFGDALANAALVSISPVTSATLTELNLNVSTEAATYNIPGVVAAVQEYWAGRNG